MATSFFLKEEIAHKTKSVKGQKSETTFTNNNFVTLYLFQLFNPTLLYLQGLQHHLHSNIL
jgi:hypothetical protein